MPFGHVVTTGQPPSTLQLQHRPGEFKVGDHSSNRWLMKDVRLGPQWATHGSRYVEMLTEQCSEKTLEYITEHDGFFWVSITL